MCVTTRYVQAIPLRKKTAVEVLKAVVTLFTRVGFPEIVQIARGTNFESD